MINKFLNNLLGAALLLGTVGVAQAAATYCVPGSNSDGLALSDMTYNGNNANDCYGVVSGNDNLAFVNGLKWGNDWSFLAKDDFPGGTTQGSGSFLGINFTLAVDAGKSGNWTLTGTDTNGTAPLNLPATLDLVGVLKGSTNFALYLFDDVVFDGTDGGTYTIKFTTKNGNSVPDISHLSLYVREGTQSDTPPNNRIPEPTLPLLLGSGLLGMTLVRRLRKA